MTGPVSETESAAPEPVDAVVMAGGRITGLYARAAGTPIKALAQVRGVPVVRRVTEALQATPGVARVCVVGAEAVREALPAGSLWQQETDSALGNLLAGVERLGEAGERRVLVCGGDVPALVPEAVADFLRRAPEEADICMPVVRREAFTAHFPGNLGIYVHLVEGAFTGGSQFLMRPRVIRENLPLMQALFQRRKSQIGMVRTMGLPLVWKLVTRRLTVGELEARLSELGGCRCRAVLDCRPELAFDIDNLPDLRYIERRQPR